MSYVTLPSSGATLPIDLSSPTEVENVVQVVNGGTGSAVPTVSLSNILVAGTPIPDVVPSDPDSITINQILAALRTAGVISA